MKSSKERINESKKKWEQRRVRECRGVCLGNGSVAARKMEEEWENTPV